MSDELREKVARVLANAMGEIGDDVWKFYLREADAAIALVSGEQADRIAQLEAALAMFACDCTVSERCTVPDNCRNFKARRMLEKRT